MKNLKRLYEELGNRDDFEVIQRTFDGGTGGFTKGVLNNCTIVWSYADGWEHVSMNNSRRVPTWDEMCIIKDMFWDSQETVVQYHPAMDNYVNNLKNCLHLWKPIEKYSGKLPIPPNYMVGIKELGTLE